MALTPKEREELKDQGYVYDRHLGRWIHHQEQDEYYRRKEKSEKFEMLIGYVAGGAVFLWMIIEITKQY